MSEAAEKPKSDTVEILEDLRAKVALGDSSAEGAGIVAALADAIAILRYAKAWDESHAKAQPDRMDTSRFCWFSQRISSGTAKPGEICAFLAEARRARADADAATDLADLLKRGLDAAQAAAEGRPVDGAISDRTVEAVLRLRSELDRLRGTVADRNPPTSGGGTVTVPPDGPHYRVKVSSMNGASVSCHGAFELAAARQRALEDRATGYQVQLQVTHNLGLTWTDCADDGGLVATATPGEEP